MNPDLYFVRCPDYGSALPDALGHLLDLTGWLRDTQLAGKRVLLKPNLLTDRPPEQAVTTHPELIRHVIRLLKPTGAKLSVGDSPASAANLQQVWQTTGIAAICEEEHVPLISFEEAGAVPFTRDGFSFTLARSVLEADLIINLPKVKSHSLTLLTAAVKNLYGAVPGYTKTTLHRLHPTPKRFGALVRALWQELPETWTIADAVTGMEGQGPANGRPVNLGFLAAAKDAFMLDLALCQILSIDARRVPYLTAHDLSQSAQIMRHGDPIEVPHFETPTGAHLLSLIPPWLIDHAGRCLWVRPAFSEKACLRCGKCVKACPAQALSLSPSHQIPSLEKARCISCCCCHEVCPADAIRMTQSRLLRTLNVFKGLA